MPLEIEVKLKLDTHDHVIEHLGALNAERLGQVRETNIFFDRPDRSLRAADQGLRVRFASRHPSIPPAEALITFKGPAAATGLRAREAFDIRCNPPEQVVPLIQALGFERVMSFEKDRDSWRLDDCLIELDTLPHFGKFLEIEGPTEEIVRAVQSKLQLDTLPHVQESYSRMVSQHLKSLNQKDLRF